MDDYLSSVELLDCSGTITHRLTLLLDGRVRVVVGGSTAIIDPESRSVSPPTCRLTRGEYTHDQVIDVACRLARGG